MRRRATLSIVLGLIAALLALGVGAAPAHAASFDVRGSAEQVHVTGVAPGTEVELLDASSDVVAAQNASSLGGVVFREVTPGNGYRVRSAGEVSAPVTVHTDDPTPWDTGFYDQEIEPEGYQYITTRDGTELALTVHPPTQPAGLIDLPPEVPRLLGLTTGLGDLLSVSYLPRYPTLIEYSGYGTANPAGPDSGIAALANLMGFAVVDVSMRGTGCSGGAFDFFEPLQALDGYDVIETIARQPWVKGGKVGMFGISYGGISQLFTAATQPPSLAAISPLSVIDSVPKTLYPGGIRNDGFAVAWAKERQQEAQPAGQGLPGTQPYAEERIAGGDTTCVANQALHPEAADLLEKIDANQTYHPEIADPLDPVTFVDKINVPVFMACQWQDEQTGGHCPMLAQRMTGTDKKWFTFTNGVHTDSLAPETFNRLYDFLHIYVAKQPPLINSVVIKAAAPLIFQTAYGIPGNDLMTLPFDPIQTHLFLGSARRAFEKQPSVRVLFNNGAGSAPLLPTSQPGTPYPGFEAGFDELPVPGTEARSWHLGPDNTLRDEPVDQAGATRYTSDATAVPSTNFTGPTGTGGLWGNQSQWSWDWQHHPDDNAVSFVTEPLGQDTVVVGAGAVEVWARSSTPDVDFQATISEVDAAGNETFVQSGWLRGSMRKLSTDSENIFKVPSTELKPIPSMREADIEAMPSDAFTKVTIPLYYEGHPYRAGTRIKVTISAPNGSQPIWAFDHTQPAGATSDVAIAWAPDMPSRLVLPVVPGVRVPTAQPECGVLRNQPCREHRQVDNPAAP